MLKYVQEKKKAQGMSVFPSQDKVSPRRLYVLTPNQIDDLAAFSEKLSILCKTQQIAAFQIRLKKASDERIKVCYQTLRPVLKKYGIPIFLNDRADLVKELGADGVHLGKEDLSLEKARRLLGTKKIIGVSCYNSKERARQLAEKGADYIAFGAFYKTPTKTPEAWAEAELLTWWQAYSRRQALKETSFSSETLQEKRAGARTSSFQNSEIESIKNTGLKTRIPCVAIGGITPENCGTLLKAGADFLAVSSSLWAGSKKIEEKLSAFQTQIRKHNLP